MAQSLPHFVPARHLELASDTSPASRGSLGHPARCSPEAFARAATCADDPLSPVADLREIWQGIIERRYAVCAEGSTRTRRFVVARTRSRDGFFTRPLNERAATVLVRVLCGDQQKLVASDLCIACSTASKWYTDAIDKTALDGVPIPLPLVFAAQSWAGDRTLAVDARCTFFRHGGEEFFSLSAQRPFPSHAAGLTHAELEVAKLAIEGASRSNIALYRATSIQTVACQLRAIFSKFRLTGRYALVGYAEQLGWFQ